MICVVDASVAVKWFAQGDWALREDNIEPALEMLKASTRGTLDFYQPPHFWQIRMLSQREEIGLK